MLELDKRYPLDAFISLNRNLDIHPESQLRKKTYEAGVVALALSRIAADFSDQPEKISVVVPDDRYDKAPDALMLIPKGRIGYRSIGLEVVSFTTYSGEEGLVRFFYRTKLSGLIRYPDPTGILCHVCFMLKKPESTCKKIFDVLKNNDGNQYPVYMICEQPGQNQFVAQVYHRFSTYSD